MTQSTISTWRGPSIMGNSSQFIGVEEWTPAYVCIIICQDSTTRTYSIKVHQDQIINPDPHNVQQWLVRVGKAGKLVLDKIIHWISVMSSTAPLNQKSEVGRTLASACALCLPTSHVLVFHIHENPGNGIQELISRNL